jgi:hypothetical protein
MVSTAYRKEWDTTICPRDKLVTVLNAIEQQEERIVIFDILSVAATQVQVVYYREIPINE